MSGNTVRNLVATRSTDAGKSTIFQFDFNKDIFEGETLQKATLKIQWKPNLEFLKIFSGSSFKVVIFDLISMGDKSAETR